MDENLKKPNDNDRRKIIENELRKIGREDDLENIINLMNIPKDIKDICKNSIGKKVKVAIIGAGISGLISAFELKKIGCDITIYEASKRVGGRVYTYYFDRAQNQYGDFGDISIPISHSSVWHYINLLNLETSPIINKNEYLYLRDSGSFNKLSTLDKKIYKNFDLDIKEKNRIKSNYHLNIKNKYIKRLTIDERKELVDIKEIYSENIKKIDNISYRDMLKKENFSNEAINLISYMNSEGEYLDYSLIEVLNKEYTVDYLLNYSIDGGMIKLPLALYNNFLSNESKVYKNIEKNDLGIVKVKFGCLVKKVSNIESEDKIELEYQNLDDNNSIAEKFDYIICTTPLTTLKNIEFRPSLSNLKLRAIDDINFESSQKLYIYVKERFWEEQIKNRKNFIGRTITDLPIYSMQYPSDNLKLNFDEKMNINIKLSSINNKAGVLLASYSSGKKAREFSNMDYEIKLNNTIECIEKIHNLEKGYLNKILIDYKHLNWDDVQYIYGFSTIFRKNQRLDYLYNLGKEEMNKKLYFAGEHVSAKNGSIQGDIQSALVMVNKIAEDINIKFKN